MEQLITRDPKPKNNLSQKYDNTYLLTYLLN